MFPNSRTSSGSGRLSRKHTKGILTLTLLLLAESVTFANAASFWNLLQNGDNVNTKNTKGPFTASCSTPLAADGSCPAPRSMLEPLSGIFQRNRRPSNNRVLSTSTTAARSMTKDTSSTSHSYHSSSCMDGHGARQCQIPRGGHIAAMEGVASATGGASAGVAPYGIPLNGWKVIFQAFLTLLNVACWLIPLRSKKISENKLALSLANAFSGGVFLSLAFGHLIPECVQGFDASNLPARTPFMLVLAGYLLIFFVEKVAFDAHDMLHGMEHENKGTAAGGDSDVATNGHDAAPVANSGRSAVILLGALAVHSILEMMALGLSDTFGDCALLSLSIALHQPAESIALLVAFLKSGMPKPQIVQFLSVFSCMGPVGVALGMAVNEFAAPIVDSIMLAIVAGTFVYVGATEVIPEEWEDPTNKWKKFAALMSGIVSILVITQYTMNLGL
jgi:zinc transporter 1/2/3